MSWTLDHVSLLVNSIDASVEALGPFAAPRGERERFEDVGTEEVYIGDPAGTALLLLQEAVGPGPYLRALKKRGPGLHHLALSTDDFEAANERLMELGWLVHPRSLRGYRRGDTVFYVKPGVLAALELISRAEPPLGQPFIEEVHVPVEPEREGCIDGLGLPGLKSTLSGNPCLRIEGVSRFIGDVV